MDEPLPAFLAAQKVFTEVVHAVGEGDWHAPTPDTEWDVAALVGHMIEEHRWAAPLLHGQDLESAAKVVEGSRSLPVDGGVGANLAQEWDEAATASAEAFSAPGALDRDVELSRGATPVRTYLEEMIFDLTVHSWDLGSAIGYSRQLPDELVLPVYERVSNVINASPSELFDRPVDVADDASMIDKLIAATGRKPR